MFNKLDIISNSSKESEEENGPYHGHINRFGYFDT